MFHPALTRRKDVLVRGGGERGETRIGSLLSYGPSAGLSEIAELVALSLDRDKGQRRGAEHP